MKETRSHEVEWFIYLNDEVLEKNDNCWGGEEDYACIGDLPPVIKNKLEVSI